MNNNNFSLKNPVSAKEPKNRIILFVFAVALAGFFFMLFTTRSGIAVSRDSIFHIMTVKFFLAGKGLNWTPYNGSILPPTRSTPLYPLMLSLISSFGIDPLLSARLLNSVLFGANIFLVGLIISKSTRSPWASLFGAFLMLSSHIMLQDHSFALTESLFYFFGLLSVFFLASYSDKPDLKMVIAASLSVAMAAFTRYVGLSFVLAGVIIIFLYGGSSRGRKFVHILIFGILSSLPAALWVIRNSLIAPKALPTTIHFDTYMLSIFVQKSVVEISRWFIPIRVPVLARIIVTMAGVLLLAVLNIYLIKQKRRDKLENTAGLSKLSQVIIIFMASYIAFLYSSVLLVVQFSGVESRYYSALYPYALIMVLCFEYKLLNSVQIRRSLKNAIIVACLIFAGIRLTHAAFVDIIYHDKRGFVGREWRQSQLMESVRKLPDDLRIYSNNPEAIYINTGKLAYFIPGNAKPQEDSDVNNLYSNQISNLKQWLDHNNAVLVYFTGNLPDLKPKINKEFLEDMELILIDKKDMGAVFEIKQRAP